MIRESESLTVAEYFAGIGLIRMGLQSAGWQVTFANDISTKKYTMYQDFFSDTDDHYVVDDIFNVDPNRIPFTTLATCSFPCIDLSLAGNMNGINGKHSSAFWGFIKALEAQGSMAPPLILVENVPGWLHSNKGSDFRSAVKAINNLGYSCDVFTLNALSFTPQSRPRIFLIGARLRVINKQPSLWLERPPSLMSERLKQRIVENSDLKWFQTEIPDPPSLRNSGLSEIIERMSDTDQRWWSDKEVKRHLDMMNDSHRIRVAKLAQGKQISYRGFFRRRRDGKQRVEVRHDDIAGCLRTAVGGSGKQFLIKMGKGTIKMRPMTPREYARLQGVPDEYPITVGGVQALTGFGDAVCVPAISWIADNILNPLAQDYLVTRSENYN